MKKFTFILIFILVLIPITDLFAYQKMTEAQIKSIHNSTTRIVNDLSGNWDVEANGKNYKRFIPFADSYNDEIILKKVVSLPADAQNQYSWHLNFAGVSNQVEVYWNEQFIGRYFDAIIPFEVKIPDKFITKNNNNLKLVIKKDDGFRNKFLMNHLFAKQNQIGPIREIFLIGKPQIWVADVKAKTEFSNNYTNAYVDIDFTISSSNIQKLVDKINKTDSVKVGFSKRLGFDYQAQLIDKITGAVVASSDIRNTEIESERSINIKSNLYINSPKLWDYANPNLYDIKVQLLKNGSLIDDFSYEYGFRDIKLVRNGDKSELFVNGRPFTMKSISYVEDYIESGQSISSSRLKDDIENIKMLGSNTIRIKYSTPSPYLVHLCNLYGMFILIDLPIYEQPSALIQKDEIQVLLKNQLNQFIESYYPAPSFMAIGLGDGFVESTDLSKDFKSTINKIKSNYKILTYQIIPINNKLNYYKESDFIGLSVNTVNDNLSKFASELNEKIKLLNSKLAFLDFGVEIQPNNHNGYSDKLSIEYQSYIIQNLFKLSETNQLLGTNYNTYNDYIRETPLLITNNEDMYINTSGLVSRDRKERMSFTSLQAMNNNEKEPLLNTGSFDPYIPYTFIIYSLVLILVLFFILNQFKRFREYIFRSLLRPYNFYSDIRDQRIISISLTIILGLIVSINLGVYLSSIFYLFKNSLGFQYIMMITLNNSILKEILVQLVWIPDLSVFFLSMVIFAFAFVVAGFVRILSMFNSKSITYNDSLILVVWGALPWLVLLPFSVILYRVLLVYPFSLVFFIILMLAIFVWTLARLAKSISVVFDLKTKLVGISTVAIVVLFFIALVLYYQIQYSIFSYFYYFLNVIA